MRIGIFSPYLESLSGGERYILTAAECLSQRHQVEIFWSNLEFKKIAQKRLAINLSKVKLMNDVFYFGDVSLFTKLQITSNYDLFIFLSDGSIPISFARRNILHFQMPFMKVGGRSWLNRIKLRKIHAVICNSKFTKRFIDAEYGVESHVIYPPVATEAFRAARKKKLILSVGRFHPLKKQHVLIEAFRKLNNSLADWKLVLVGGLLKEDKDYFKQLQQQTAGLKIELLVNIDFNRLQDLYGSANIYWHAAGFGEDEEENPGRMEHFGITTVESMAAGCAPISFRGGGQKEIIEHTQNGFLWETVDELIKYTLEIARNNRLRRKIAKQAQNDSRQFGSERFGRELEALVSSL